MSSSEASDEQAPAPAKKRKKKRKAEGARDVRPGWPSFAKSFPDHPAVESLVVAFEQGNYASVREGAKKILEQTNERAGKSAKSATSEKSAALLHPQPKSPEERDAIRSAARDILQRTEPDPLAVYMVLGAVLLLAFLSIWYWSHPHGATP
jgi:hypothetical protein